jgi:phage/plasmid-like protein (TIGR03299 family)
MAHNLTERDGMFTVRQAAWHGLGDVLPEHPTREQAQAIAHPWEPISEPIYRRVPVVMDDGSIKYGYRQIEGFQGIVRSDDASGKGALGVTTDAYEPVKNSVMYDIADAIEGEASGSVMYETGGSLLGGRKVWLLIRLRDPLIINGDPHGGVIPYYALQNSHDGSMAFRGQATMTRIVCDNTSQMADIDAQARGTEFAFRHSSNVAERIEEAKNALTGWRESVQQYRLFAEEMLSRTITREDRGRFVTEFIPMPPPHMASDRVMQNVHEARQTLTSILASQTCAGIDLTAWGLVQAATEYQQHYRAARSGESRFKRAYLDRSTVVRDAIEIAKAVSI